MPPVPARGARFPHQPIGLVSAQLQRTLRQLTERLALEVAQPGQPEPDWSRREWALARAVATMHGVASLLFATSSWRGAGGWREFLGSQFEHTRRRHTRIEALLLQFDQQARALKLPMLALKGAALHRLGVYRPGERPMADIDLLVAPKDAGRAGELLESMGYEGSEPGWKERLFMPAGAVKPTEYGEHQAYPIKIELHLQIAERLPQQVRVLRAALLDDARAALQDYPSLAALMLHLLFHAAGAMPARGLRLIQLEDIARLAERMTQADWQTVLEHPETWWAYPPLFLTASNYPASIPQWVLARARPSCRGVLRYAAERVTLFEASYCYLWVDAFPGWQWSQSFGESLQYLATRIAPARAQRLERDRVLEQADWAALSTWSRASQLRRILRWLVKRPMRPLTIHSVQGALDSSALSTQR